MTSSFRKFISSSEKIPFQYITRYDVLKSFALITMLIDHLGYYFMPDNPWPRIPGRLSFPIWLFLIGYAKSRSIDKKLIIGATLLIIADLVFGMTLVPLNILWVIIAVRLCLNPITRLIGQSEALLFGVMGGLCILHPYISFIGEYGSLAVLMAMAGYYRRHSFGTQPIIAVFFAVLTFAYYIFAEQQAMNFTAIQTILMTIGLGGVFAALWFYLPEPKEKPQTDLTTHNDPTPVAIHRPWLRRAFQFMGRNTLEIYVAHLLVFKLIYFIIQEIAIPPN